MIDTGRSKHILKLLLLLIAAAGFAASCIQQAPRMPVTITSSSTPEPIAVKASDKTFKNFSHTIKEHKQFECASCHAREGRSLDMEFAGHESCVGCHISQFTSSGPTTSDEPAMCTICHKDLDSVPPGMNEFPREFNESFNMKFDHADHDSGAGRPPAGCASCHQSAGAGKTIPSGFRAHNNCYTCHTAESKIGSCSTCHEIAPYNRTQQSRYVFRAVFTHGDHGSVSCADCHSVVARAPQGRQVTNITASQHNGGTNNCVMCHNGSRAFGGNGPNDFANCARCHKGSGFDMLPGS
ncbi:MAG: cytochrome c3 family protein [Pyrinomonadaceae bacterium]